MDDKPIILSSEVILNLLFMSRIVFTTALCCIITPLGVPVEPDVKIMYANDDNLLLSKTLSQEYLLNFFSSYVSIVNNTDALLCCSI